MNKETIARTDILGTWVSDNNEVKMRIYENAESGCFNGKITWIIEDESSADGPVLDVLNPNDDLKQRPIAGLDFITDLRFNEKKKEWQKGHLYSPEDGKTYHLKVWFLDDKDTLNIRPSLDATGLMGKSFRWCRSAD